MTITVRDPEFRSSCRQGRRRRILTWSQFDVFEPNNFFKCKLWSIKLDWKCIQVDLIWNYSHLVEKMRMRFLNLIFGFLNFSACNQIPSPIEVVNQVLSHWCISVQSWVYFLFDLNSAHQSQIFLFPKKTIQIAKDSKKGISGPKYSLIYWIYIEFLFLMVKIRSP